MSIVHVYVCVFRVMARAAMWMTSINSQLRVIFRRASHEYKLVIANAQAHIVCRRPPKVMFSQRTVKCAQRQLSSTIPRDFLGKPSWSIAKQLRAGQEQPVRLSDEDVRRRL